MFLGSAVRPVLTLHVSSFPDSQGSPQMPGGLQLPLKQTPQGEPTHKFLPMHLD